MRRALLRLVLTAALAAGFGRAAWARGGGGGGGHGGGGGFGGGFHGGGFGGGYHGGSGGYGGGGSADGWAVFWLLVFLAAIAGVFVWSAAAGRRRLRTVAVVLRRGAHYVGAMERLTARASLDTAAGRAQAMAALAALVDPRDVFDGFVVSDRSGFDRRVVGGQAQALWRRQMQTAGITPQVLNVASLPSEHRDERPLPSPGATGAEVCLAGFVVAVGGSAVRVQGEKQEAKDMLRRLPALPAEAFYFFFTPNSGEGLSLTEGKEALADLHRDALRT